MGRFNEAADPQMALAARAQRPRVLRLHTDLKIALPGLGRSDRCATESHCSWCSQTGYGLGPPVGRFEERARAEGEGEVAALRGKFWTPEEDNRLRILFRSGKIAG